MFGKLSLSAIIFYSGLLFAADTQLNLYRPFAMSSKQVTPYITSTISGHCSHQSERIKREDAWHCISNEDVIYDPCFTKRFGVISTL